MSVRRRRLKNFWINNEYQGRYVLSLIVSSLLALLVFATVFYLFTKENYEVLVELSPMTPEVYNELQSELISIALYIGLTGFVFLILVSLIGIVFSHRAAGPLYNIQSVCKKIQNGELTARIRLRPNDDFQDVAMHLNAALDCVVFSQSRRFVVDDRTSSYHGVILPFETLQELFRSGGLSPNCEVKPVGAADTGALILRDVATGSTVSEI